MANIDDDCFWFPNDPKCKTEPPKPDPTPKPKPTQTDTEPNRWEEPFINPIAG